MVKTLKNLLIHNQRSYDLELSMYHWGLKLYKVYIYDDPGLTLTYSMARSNWVTCTFEWGKLLQSQRKRLFKKAKRRNTNIIWDQFRNKGEHF